MEDMVKSYNPLAADLDHILVHTEGLWEDLRGRRIFITGGTGFFGCWLLESFAWANAELDLGASALVLTRDPDAFRQKAPHLAADPAIHFHVGDVRDFGFPAGQFSHVIHGATESSSQLGRDDPLLMLDTIVAGTRRVLDFARACGAGKLLLISSGAVYGRQPPELLHIPEDYAGGPDPLDPASSYAEGKRLGELLAAIYACQYGLQVKIARCFAFVGPYLPLDRHFAVGNFVRDALQGGPIRVNGDGTPYRSYLYAADLAVWLWTILVRGSVGRAYNVGSEDAISMGEVAGTVAEAVERGVTVTFGRQAVAGLPAERYVPATTRARAELGLRQHIALREGLVRSMRWHMAGTPTTR